MSEQGDTMYHTMYQRGDLVWTRIASGEWARGIVTDVFVAPMTGREVVVVNGNGYYADDDVVADTAPEPQSLRVEVGVREGDMIRCARCNGTGEYAIPGFRVSACPACDGLGKVVAPPQSLRA